VQSDASVLLMLCYLTPSVCSELSLSGFVIDRRYVVAVITYCIGLVAVEFHELDSRQAVCVCVCAAERRRRLESVDGLSLDNVLESKT